MPAPSSPRTDIQGLRALAVAAVLGFHLWPASVTGGYVGVDVFFVVSGFLITSHLLRRPIRSGRDLLGFWARRVRRLIPAASLVLLVTLVASAVWLPTTTLVQVGREVLASALYVENWALASAETDYLAADQLHSPVQHYWSLSIEEQFYLVWPLLLAAVAWAGLRARRRRRDPERTTAALAVALTGAVLVASLGWSVWMTWAEPAAAYFVSTTRFWELALGGLLAAVLARRAVRAPVPAQVGAEPGTPRSAGVLRVTAAWAGLAMIAVAVLTFDAATPFPGYTALLPTVGALLVILADADRLRGGPGGALRWRPVQWLGDTSYSVYLWHWPLIVVVPFALGRDLGTVDLLAILVGTLLLAWFSQRHVEDRLRFHPALTRRLGATFALLGACVVVVGGAAVGVWVTASAAERDALAEARTAVAQAAPCVGAEVVRDDDCADPGLLLGPTAAAQDKPVVYADGCWNNAPFTTRNTCTYGPGTTDDTEGTEGPTARLALVGNSHAGHWVPALEDAIATDGWQLDTYLQSVCYTVDAPIEFPGEGVSEACQATNRWAVGSIVAGGYDLAIMSDRTDQHLAGVPREQQDAAAEDAYRETLATFTDAGIPVLVLRDTPAMPENVPDCLAQHAGDPDACGAPPAQALEPDPLAAAARADTTGLVSVTSVDHLMCDEICHPVVGGITAYFDHGHLTATFARTLAPEVTGAVRAALEGPP
ncbi:peptidoglycan/LPS O-acetylase OafA/YrhL [Isoptericola sp. CG 20/1183]|uniref:Peptidoglycan/LPS O-acetylase OafA/YrhL n=1 Tax=Isoptericola halotolerans TaxID=300560 RepID=A0ABX5E9M1_9MICO|nr:MULTISPECIES: acyltransferase family protein [Isoptericola]PRZ03042.1 peptidoglycan/LPS O-acetylase OafA/YrhL [Isoptericola sp. CG 20/1183]PRZ03296.1 peptidoglycan/LPS O-acetylase OafA/YrhL [Isoptericola halotolerans]